MMPHNSRHKDQDKRILKLVYQSPYFLSRKGAMTVFARTVLPVPRDRARPCWESSPSRTTASRWRVGAQATTGALRVCAALVSIVGVNEDVYPPVEWRPSRSRVWDAARRSRLGRIRRQTLAYTHHRFFSSSKCQHVQTGSLKMRLPIFRLRILCMQQSVLFISSDMQRGQRDTRNFLSTFEPISSYYQTSAFGFWLHTPKLFIRYAVELKGILGFSLSQGIVRSNKGIAKIKHPLTDSACARSEVNKDYFLEKTGRCWIPHYEWDGTFGWITFSDAMTTHVGKSSISPWRMGFLRPKRTPQRQRTY